MIPSGNENIGGVVTSHDVPRLAGVSQATVSRVLRQDPKVRPETRDRVAGRDALPTECRGSCVSDPQYRAIGIVVARPSYQLSPAMLESIGAWLGACRA